MLKRRVALFFVISLFSFIFKAGPGESSPLNVVPDYPVLPIVHGVMQGITIDLSSPTFQDGEEFEMFIKAESGLGVLLLDDVPLSSGRLIYKAGKPVTVTYRWAGPLPTEEAHPERVTVSVPALQLISHGDFSVGMNLQIKGIKVPEQAQAGAFTQVRIVIEDAFHRDINISGILKQLGIKPEIKMSLEAVGGSFHAPVAFDPVIKRFFGSGGESAQRETVYPSGELSPGDVLRADDGSYYWVTSVGREPGIIPQFAGEYRLNVSMKANSGGLAIRERASEPFKTSGAEGTDIAEGIPDIIGSTVRIASGINRVAAESIARDVRGALNDGDRTKAAALLGSGLRAATSDASLRFIGQYLNALCASGMNMDVLSAFMADFLKGYVDYGALVLTRGGVKSWSALTQDKVQLKPAPEGRVYAGEQYLIIPFELGKNFTLNISGSNTADVSLWKIIPSGVNTKKYPKGSWNKEIAVYTEQLTPPVLN